MTSRSRERHRTIAKDPKIKAVIFDAYGTLLDVHGAMAAHADRLPPDWERISAEWRTKQLEYSWVHTLTGRTGADFWSVTQEALAFVAARHRITDPAVQRALLDSYLKLPAYADAAATLRDLRAQGLGTAILSNGSPAMLASAVDAAGLAPLLDAVLSVQELGVFKPDPRVYALATRHYGCAADELGFVSSNAWDAQAAQAAGMRVFWCNRTEQPQEYGLAAGITALADLPPLLRPILQP